MTARHLATRIHPDDRIDPGKVGPQVMRHVTVNVAESPIAWLAARGMLTPEQLHAGERLRLADARIEGRARAEGAGAPGVEGPFEPLHLLDRRREIGVRDEDPPPPARRDSGPQGRAFTSIGLESEEPDPG